jgi:hypothetical protein
MQAGLTMRFPRITEYRGKGTKNPKNPDEVADLTELRTIFNEQEDTRQNDVSFGSAQQETSRFLTAKQLQGGKLKAAKKSRKKIDEVKQFNIPGAATPLSHILDGLTFTVLPGNYCLGDDTYATAEAKEDGWESCWCLPLGWKKNGLAAAWEVMRQRRYDINERLSSLQSIFVVR